MVKSSILRNTAESFQLQDTISALPHQEGVELVALSSFSCPDGYQETFEVPQHFLLVKLPQRTLEITESGHTLQEAPPQDNDEDIVVPGYTMTDQRPIPRIKSPVYDFFILFWLTGITLALCHLFLRYS